MPIISVVMSVYRESLNELRQSIYSILCQDFCSFEYIIVDDNPRSLSIKKFLLNVKMNNENVLLLFNRHNLGAANSRNRGIHYSKGLYIAIMDADDVAYKNRLSSQIHFLKKYNLDFVFPNYGLITSNNDVLRTKCYNFKSLVDQKEIHYIFDHITDIGINSGWLVKRCVFKKLHGYRNMIIEDYDFIMRALYVGYNLGYQSKILMNVRFRNNSIMRTNALKSYLAAKFLRCYMNKNSICTVKSLNSFLESYINCREVKRFNKLLIICHKVKYNFKFHNIILLVYYILITRFSVDFIMYKIITPLRLSKMNIK